MRILVIDVGGTNIKLRLSEQEEVRKFESGHLMTPQQMIDGVRANTSDWPYEAVAIGFPAAGHQRQDHQGASEPRPWLGGF